MQCRGLVPAIISTTIVSTKTIVVETFGFGAVVVECAFSKQSSKRKRSFRRPNRFDETIGLEAIGFETIVFETIAVAGILFMCVQNWYRVAFFFESSSFWDCGTVRPSDLVTDAGAAESFGRSAAAIWGKIRDRVGRPEVRKACPRVRHLLAVGHSLGAAVAVRVAHLWAVEGGGVGVPIVPAAVLFGCPPGRRLEGLSWAVNVVFGHDVVARLSVENIRAALAAGEWEEEGIDVSPCVVFHYYRGEVVRFML